jgi:hypothetical protein
VKGRVSIKTVSKKFVNDLKLEELKEELKKRQIVQTGNKEEKRCRLKNILTKDELDEEGKMTVITYNYRSVTEMVEDLGWEKMSVRRKRARASNIYRAISGSKAWKDVKDMLNMDGYRGRKDHDFKIFRRTRKTAQGNSSLLGQGISEWNSLSTETFRLPLPNAKAFRARLNEV